MAQFAKGNPGRRRGSTNKATREIQDAARAILTRPAYVASLKERLDEGKAPHMETLLHHYAYGKPKDKVELTGADAGPLNVIFGGRFREGAHGA